jgi:hypothetical protein
MNDSEKNPEEFLTGRGNGMRFNQGKLRYDLVNPKAYEDLVQVLTDGATKYKSRNWEAGLSWTSVLASLKRHIAAIEKGEDYDKESGRLHIAHAACNAHFLNTFYYTFPQGDDRVKSFLKIPKIGLDLDGVIANWTGAWNKVYPEVLVAPNSWYLDRKVGKRFQAMREAGTLDDFYMQIEPLIKSEDLPFEPHCYITSRPVSKEISEAWLDKYHFPAKPVYSVDLRESKVEVAKDAGVEIFVDDAFENFVELNNGGIFTYLYSAPWNLKHDIGHMRINSLKDIPLLK